MTKSVLLGLLSFMLIVWCGFGFVAAVQTGSIGFAVLNAVMIAVNGSTFLACFNDVKASL